MTHYFKVFSRLAFLLINLFLLACSDSGGSSGGNFRYVQLSINTPRSDLLIDNKERIGNIEFLENSGFMGGPNEDFNLKVAPSESNNQTATSFVNSNFREIDETTTYISIGVYRNTPAADVIAVSTDRTPSESNDASIKWVHASPGYRSIPFDIFVVPESNNCRNLSGFFPFTENLSYGNSSNYRTLDSGKYDICVVPRRNGTDWLVIDNYEFKSRSRRTIVVFEDDETFRLGIYDLDDVKGGEVVRYR